MSIDIIVEFQLPGRFEDCSFFYCLMHWIHPFLIHLMHVISSNYVFCKKDIISRDNYHFVYILYCAI
jgi:hypothetical protein